MQNYTRQAHAKGVASADDNAPIVTLGDKQAADLLEAFALWTLRNTLRMSHIQPGPEVDTMVHASKADAGLALSIANDLRKNGGTDKMLAMLAVGGDYDKRFIKITGGAS